jgi:hypothetical protein
MTDLDLRWPDWAAEFAWLAAPGEDDPWRLDMWWGGTGRDAQLLYAWAFAWRSTEPRPCWVDGSATEVAETSINAITFTGPFSQTAILLDAIAGGESLATASDAASIEAPPAALCDAALGRAHLGRTRIAKGRGEEPGAKYVEAPWRLLPSRDSFAQELSSPAAQMPALRAALVRLRKTELLPAVHDAATSVLTHLARETGLSFLGNDLPRLGDLEVLVFPASALARREAVSIQATDDAIRVLVAAGLVPPRAKVRVRCRQAHAGAVLADQQVLGRADEQGKVAVRFRTSPVGPSGASVEVWHDQNGTSRLMYQHTAAFIRRVQVSMRAITEGRGADWLIGWARGRRTSNRLQTLGYADLDVVTVGEPDEMWQQAESSAKALANVLRPPTERGAFVRQWRGDAARVEGVRSWFKTTFGRGDGGSIVLLLPIFDAMTVGIVGRLTSGGRKVFVVTTAAHAKQRESIEGALKGLRAEGLSESLGIYEVPSVQCRTAAVFEIDHAGRPRRGFHLSLGLDEPETEAFLATPITEAVLGEFVDAIAETLEASTLFAPAGVGEMPTGRSFTKPDATAMAAAEQALEHASDASFVEAWTEYAQARFYHTQSSHLLGDALHHARGWMGDTAFGQHLARLVADWPLQAAKDREGIRDLLRAAALPFEAHRDGFRGWTYARPLHRAPWPFVHGLQILASVHPRLLAASVDSIFEEASRSSESASVGYKVQLVLSVLGELRNWSPFDPVARDALLKTIEPGLAARNAFARYTFATLLGPQTRAADEGEQDGNAALAEVRSVLSALARAEERVLTIAEWIGDLPTDAGASDVGAPESRSDVLDTYVRWIREEWPSTTDSPLMSAVVDRCDRPGGAGARARLITNEILIPLQRSNKVRARLVARVWFDVLEDRLRKTLIDREHFFAERDVPLTEVCAYFVGVPLTGDASEQDDLFPREHEAPEYRETIARVLERLADIRRTAKRMIVRPFADSLQHSDWDSARRTLAWLEAFALIVRLQDKSDPHVQESVRVWVGDTPRAEHDALDASRLFFWVDALHKHQGGTRSE